MKRFRIPPCDLRFAPPGDIDVPFEGVEKRLVVHFKPSSNMLRPYDLSREEWQSLLNYAFCDIVSVRELEDSKVYLLSESTLTVWPSGFLLKTCGRTTPFLVLKAFAEHIYSDFSGQIDWLLYSRLDFLHPQFQVWPHQSHQQEFDFIKDLLPGTNSFALPAGDYSLVGFVYNPEVPNTLLELEETLMMKIDRHCVGTFSGFDTPEEQILHDDNSVRHGYLRGSIDQECRKELDEFWFTPFGYSCNALAASHTDKAATYFSCHVSPEPATSYASLEVGGCKDYVAAHIPLTSLVPAFNAEFVHLTKVTVQSELVINLEEQLNSITKSLQLGYQVCESSATTIGYLAVYHTLLRRPTHKIPFLSLADCPNLTDNKLSHRNDPLANALTTASGDELSDRVAEQTLSD